MAAKKLQKMVFLLILLFSNCKYQIDNSIIETEKEELQADLILEQNSYESESLPTLGIYFYMDDIYAPDGKMLRAYINEIKETTWGAIYSPIIYLFDIEKNVLATFITLDMISEEFWSGEIKVNYNNERNSFDMIFSLGPYGNYGTGYIDLNNNKYFRELLTIPIDEQFERDLERQGIPDGYIEGSNLQL